jgi:hypothetical protein
MASSRAIGNRADLFVCNTPGRLGAENGFSLPLADAHGSVIPSDKHPARRGNVFGVTTAGRLRHSIPITERLLAVSFTARFHHPAARPEVCLQETFFPARLIKPLSVTRIFRNL